MITKTERTPPAATEAQGQDDDPAVSVSCHITEPSGTTYSASIMISPDETLASISAALLATASGAATTHGPVLAALFRDLVETQRALANAVPAGNGLRLGIRVSDVDVVISEHRGSDHHPRLGIPGLEHAVDADVVRAILVAAGAF